MNDAPAERPDLLKRCLQIADRKIWQRGRVSGSATTTVYADDRTLLSGLPALPFDLVARLEGCAKQRGPKVPRTLGVVGRKLNQR